MKKIQTKKISGQMIDDPGRAMVEQKIVVDGSGDDTVTDDGDALDCSTNN